MVDSFQVFTDSGSDLPPSLAREWGIKVVPLTFSFPNWKDADKDEYLDGEMSSQVFYSMLAAGQVAKTAAVNPEQFRQIFERCLRRNQDVLYIGLSLGLSTTFSNAYLAASELEDEYPGRQIRLVDSLTASMAVGLLALDAAGMARAGRTVNEAADWIEHEKMRMRCMAVMSNCETLRLGGRISHLKAIGTMLTDGLGFRPCFKMDNEGKVAQLKMVKGDRSAREWLFSELRKQWSCLVERPIAICHANAANEAQLLRDLIVANLPIRPKFVISELSSTIGSHVGPGTISLFYCGRDDQR